MIWKLFLAGMKKITLVMALLLSLAITDSRGTAEQDSRPDFEREIWALENAYLTHHREANHEKILPLWHDQFLGWPDLEPGPADKKAATRRLDRKYPEPASWTFRIEPAGIQVVGNVAVNYYTLHFTEKDDAGVERKWSRRIMHTWVKDATGWKILGGMSKQEE